MCPNEFSYPRIDGEDAADSMLGMSSFKKGYLPIKSLGPLCNPLILVILIAQDRNPRFDKILHDKGPRFFSYKKHVGKSAAKISDASITGKIQERQKAKAYQCIQLDLFSLKSSSN